jgi:hypothetical protein
MGYLKKQIKIKTSVRGDEHWSAVPPRLDRSLSHSAIITWSPGNEGIRQGVISGPFTQKSGSIFSNNYFLCRINSTYYSSTL